MPELPEVEKLRLQLVPSWPGRRVVRFTAPASSPNPMKYVQGNWKHFSEKIRSQRMTAISRLGKAIVVHLEEPLMWHIHLNSTGWWMPGNEAAMATTRADPIFQNFLHSVNEQNIRLKMHLDDNQVWFYHDSRTWGKWYLREGRSLSEDSYFAGYGPDWLLEPKLAQMALIAHNSPRTTKVVLCDQKITAGLGNYLACEAAYGAGIHPHRPWNQVEHPKRVDLASAISRILADSLVATNHDHWQVFDRKGHHCGRCNYAQIQYVKDKGGARGSYFCPVCQPYESVVSAP